MEKVSYALGHSVAGNLVKSGINSLNTESFAKGLKDGLAGEFSEMSSDQMNQVLNDFFSTLQQKAYTKNIEEGKSFLSENAKKSNVVTLTSGLQYTILKEGNGSKPKATDRVKCHYHGTLIDGKVFDSSIQRGTPAVFPVNGVIQGWIEALQLMNVGSKWKLFIPSELAYGEHGAGSDIGPHTTLIFEVELLDIV